MWVKLKKDYKGYWRGSVIKVNDREGKLLIQKGVAIHSEPDGYMTKEDLDFALKKR